MAQSVALGSHVPRISAIADRQVDILRLRSCDLRFPALLTLLPAVGSPSVRRGEERVERLGDVTVGAVHLLLRDVLLHLHGPPVVRLEEGGRHGVRKEVGHEGEREKGARDRAAAAEGGDDLLAARV